MEIKVKSSSSRGVLLIEEELVRSLRNHYNKVEDQ